MTNINNSTLNYTLKQNMLLDIIFNIIFNTILNYILAFVDGIARVFTAFCLDGKNVVETEGAIAVNKRQRMTGKLETLLDPVCTGI